LFKTATLQKCRSGLDDKIKSQITGKLLKFSPPMARLFYRNYKIISLILLVVFIWSGWIGGMAIYNYAVYGNCNGFDSDGFCIIDAVAGSEDPNAAVDASLISCDTNEVVEEPHEDIDKYGPCPCGAGG